MMRAFLLLGALIAAPAAAAPSCQVPAVLPRAHVEGATDDQPRRVVPIGGYTLALIWTPQHCRRAVRGAESFRCERRGRFGFTLHGLWPDGEGKEWPQWCTAAPLLPARTVAAHYCATPSPQLLQHEWAKHGTCMPGYTPERYFDLSNRLFGELRFPRMASLSRGPLTVGDFSAAFAARNPAVPRSAIRVTLDREGWLEELWLCLDTRFKAVACKAPALPAGRRMRIWRGFR